MKMHIDGGPKLPDLAPDRLYSVKQGDSLSLIAGRQWGDVLFWPLLYNANKDLVGPNPNYLRIGLRLTIPDISRFSQAELDQARTRGRHW
jgi:nucleoid-associated protein YgaU